MGNASTVSKILEGPEYEKVRQLAEESINQSLDRILERQGRSGAEPLEAGSCFSLLSVVITAAEQ
ncbi:hypothetical protein [Streptomyces sp. NPDC026092]|uniref:hypothetical protein n=1 Tax=Streptomyces sp. NPDC026092 TaxID=3154797 RepID=UPI0033C36025